MSGIYYPSDGRDRIFHFLLFLLGIRFSIQVYSLPIKDLGVWKLLQDNYMNCNTNIKEISEVIWNLLFLIYISLGQRYLSYIILDS